MYSISMNVTDNHNKKIFTYIHLPTNLKQSIIINKYHHPLVTLQENASLTINFSDLGAKSSWSL